MTNTNNTTKIAQYLKNRIREVETIDSATKERSINLRAVNLRASDFSDRAEFKGYKTRSAQLAAAVHAYDNAKTNEEKSTTKKTAISALQAIYDYFKTVAKIDGLTAQEVDIKYIKRLQANRKLNKADKVIEVNQKSLSAFMSLVEDCLYFRLNGLKFPTFNQSKTVAAEIEKAKAEQAKTEEKAKTEKTSKTAIKAEFKPSKKAAQAVA